ncbi:MAG: lipopolysaccharide biosynthesis protein [Lachnospiraceae bacterium]|nr:lipopolysaccharide biosynthesis protein [Lachnospiraceae bacterium]
MKNNKLITKIIYKNFLITLIAQLIQIALGFVVRRLFINYLGVSYLGYNSVFQNILQMLNLADMGIGVAITSFLYVPIAYKDEKKIKSLMYLYKKIYEFTGLIVLIIGIIISIFLPKLIPDANCSNEYLRILFYINLIGTVSTYYLAYNRTLIIADQKAYITSIIDIVSMFVMSLIQIVVLIYFPSYILYLIVNIAKNVVSNIILSIKSNKLYGGIIREEIDLKELCELKPQVFSYVKDVFISRVGAFIYYGTDNVIISIFRGSLIAGYLSNYTLVTTQVLNISSQILSSVQATFGNFISVHKDLKEQKKMTDIYFCANYCIANFCLICVMFLIQPFINLVFGSNYVLSKYTSILLSVNLMLCIMIQLPSQLFVIYKLYKYDKPIIIVSAIINIILSCSLVKSMGIDGVLIGTFVTSLLYLFSRLYIISKYIYMIFYSHYVKEICKYGLISVVNVAITYLLIRGIPGTSFALFSIRSILVILSATVFPSVFLCITKEFTILVDKIIPLKIKKYYSRWLVWGCSIVLTILFVVVGQFVKRINTYKADITNKSLPRYEVCAVDNTEIINRKVFHLSLDDFIIAFEDITENEDKYCSIFDNATFAWMKELHDSYGVVFSCYVFCEDGKFRLEDCSTKYYMEFKENADWLRFGFHSIDANTIYNMNTKNKKIGDDYSRTIMSLQKIVSNDAIDNFIRLQSFQGTEEQIEELTELELEPVIGLLTADDGRQSYYLNKQTNKQTNLLL